MDAEQKLIQIIRSHGNIQTIDIPNEVTISAIDEGRKLMNAENADGYKDIEELRAALGLTDGEKIDIAAARILKRFKPAFEEFAK